MTIKAGRLYAGRPTVSRVPNEARLLVRRGTAVKDWFVTISLLVWPAC
jgi:hypothetical protein